MLERVFHFLGARRTVADSQLSVLARLGVKVDFEACASPVVTCEVLLGVGRSVGVGGTGS